MKGWLTSILQRARYHMHNLLVRGTAARIIAFTIITMVICLILALILSLVADPEEGLLTSIWNAMLCVLDGGTIAGIEANDGQRAVLFITTLFGIVFTSVLVGIITTGIEERLEKTAHEGSKVLEHRQHLLVLGHTQMTTEVLRKLAQSYGQSRHVKPIVVLEEERDIVEVGKEIESALRNFPKIRGIYRQGCPYSENDLDLCSIENARAIFVTEQRDDDAVKTILVCTSLLKNLGRKIPIFVVCENEDVFDLLPKDVSELIDIISPDTMLARSVEALQYAYPSTQTISAGDAVEFSDQTGCLLITANDHVEREESDNLVVRSLLELRSLCEKRRAEGNPLEIVCMLYFDKNVDSAVHAGADKTVLVGDLLAGQISNLIEHMQD